MNADRVLVWIETAVLKPMGKEVSDLQRNIFQQAWEDDSTYEAIAKATGYEESHVRDKGSQLFGWLRVGLDETGLKKTNFRGIVQRHYEMALAASESPEPQLTEPQPTEPQLTAQNPTTPVPIDQAEPLLRNGISFMGREKDIQTIQQYLQDHSIVLIHGEGGLGKTTLARKYLESEGYRMLSIWMPAESQTMVTPVVEEWLSGEFGQAVGQDFRMNLDRLRRCLNQSPTPIGILIDNLEIILDGQGRVIEAHRCYLELLRFLDHASVNVVTLITSRQTLKESGLTTQCHKIQGIAETAWAKYFQHHHIQVSGDTLAEIWQACLGNPEAMRMLRGAASSEFDNDLDQCWQSYDRNLMVNGALQHLVETQIQAIQRNHPAAYQLFCRLGAYRYQNNITSVGIAGVKAMLWDVSAAQQSSVIQALRDRALLETRPKQEIYWLHPMLLSEAAQRLRQSEDWETSHRQASAFWLASIASIDSVDDAQRVLEAYHHYLEIDDYEAAANVLTTHKANCWNTPIAVGWLFYRFSLLQQITSAILRIIDHIPRDMRTARLYNLLGYVSRLGGELDNAQKHHTEALLITRQLRSGTPSRLEIKQLEASSLLNLGLCYRDRWELTTALEHFKEVRQIAESEKLDDRISEYVIYANCNLAYIYACQNNRSQAALHIRKVPHLAFQYQLTSWGRACTLIYLASTYLKIGDVESGIDLYQESLGFAEKEGFTHIIAQANHGLAQVNRVRERYDKAIEQHTIAIEGLQQITAKCDLAKAYVQRGITYRELKKTADSEADFAAAEILWQTIGAPKRLAWLQREIIGEIDDD
jgi:tetratricopeptide (TPR) repeat protein